MRELTLKLMLAVALSVWVSLRHGLRRSEASKLARQRHQLPLRSNLSSGSRRFDCHSFLSARLVRISFSHARPEVASWFLLPQGSTFHEYRIDLRRAEGILHILPSGLFER